MRRGQSTLYVLGFAAAICIVCSLLIAGAALGLRPLQQKNIEIDKKKNVLAAAGITGVAKEDVISTFKEKVTAKVVDLSTGAFSDTPLADLNEAQLTADVYKMKTDAEKNLRPIYIVGSGADQVTILPVAGKGLWSTVYGFLAMKKDLNTIKGVTFYKHGETPGLGGECEKEWFTKNFIGKTVKDAGGNIVFGVAKGKASAPTCKSFGGVEHCVDGMSGATLTGTGIKETVRSGIRDFSAFIKAQGS